MLAMLISSLVGTLIPMFSKIHIDPAVASGPLITTVNDLVAVVTYYGLAWIFLIEIMHFKYTSAQNMPSVTLMCKAYKSFTVRENCFIHGCEALSFLYAVFPALSSRFYNT